jgi:surface antigen
MAARVWPNQAAAVEVGQIQAWGRFMYFVRVVAVVLIGGALAACANDAGPREQTGTLLGAITGAIIGSQVAGPGNRTTGAIIGATLGSLVGNRIGAAMDEEDKRLAYAAQIEALESSDGGRRRYEWRNPKTGRYGEVMPGRAYTRDGQRCREYTHTIYVDGQREVVRGTACQNPDRSWSAIG